MRRPHLQMGIAAALALSLAPVSMQGVPDEAHAFLVKKERWAIKTGADPIADRIRTDPPQASKVAQLIHFERPPELPANTTSRPAQIHRYSDIEETVYAVDADILRYELDTDNHDYRIVIRDHGDLTAEDAPIDSGQRRTMIAVIPDPAVVVQSSPWRGAIVAAHREFTRQFHPGPAFTDRVTHARITGVGFFELTHGQPGGAINGLELHPVLKIEILDGTSGDVRFHRSPKRQTKVQPAGETANPMVWVNLGTGIYWQPGTRYYGKTRRGRYMSEQEAIKAGFLPARGRK